MGLEKMKIKLPDHDVSRRLIIGGWMLFPKPEDEDLRKLYRSAVQHIHVMRDLKIAGQPIDPGSRRYKWKASGNGSEMIAVEQDTSTMEANETGMVLLGSPEKIVEFFHDYQDFLRRANFNFRLKEGIASGLVLLASCVFQGLSKRPHLDGKGAAEKAVAKMIDLTRSSVRGYFKEFGCVAHLWAAWLLQVLSENDSLANGEILKDVEYRVPIDFMSDADVDATLTSAKYALDFGRKTISTRTVLFDEINSIEFDWPEKSGELIEMVPSTLVEMLKKHRETSAPHKAR